VTNKQKLFNEKFKSIYGDVKRYEAVKLKAGFEFTLPNDFDLPNILRESSWDRIAQYLGYSGVKEIHEKGFVLACDMRGGKIIRIEKDSSFKENENSEEQTNNL